MSANPLDVLNDHENDSKTNSKREKLLQEVTHLVRVAMRPEKEKDIKWNTGKRRSSVESQPKRVSTERFRIFDEEEQFKWELDSPELPKYANDHFNVFIQEKNLKDNISIKTTAPSNMLGKWMNSCFDF